MAGNLISATMWTQKGHTVAVSAAEIIEELPKLTDVERRAVLNRLRELLQIDEAKWEQLLNDPRPRPKLETFVRESAGQNARNSA